MAKKLEKSVELDKQTEMYDVWEMLNGSNSLGSYFVPKSVSGEEYEAALASAKQKLMSLGFTTLEVKAILGRQLF
jgi:hypothetical protein